MLHLFCFASFRLYTLFEAAALRSIVLQYAGAPIATRVSFSFLEMSLFPSIFFPISTFSWYGEYAVRSFLPNGVFYRVTTGWIFDISLRENSINQSNMIICTQTADKPHGEGKNTFSGIYVLLIVL